MVTFPVIEFYKGNMIGFAKLKTMQKKEREMSDFLVVYPGQFTEREKPLVEKYMADAKALEKRGEVDVRALINGKLPENTPGVGPIVKINEAMIRYNNSKYDPENPVLNDAAYAKKLGYQDIIAYPSFTAHDDTYILAYPAAARDTLLVSQLNHSIFNYKPVYPGDTIFLVVNARHIIDATPPEGSIYRSLAMQFEGCVYNQKGEKVTGVIFRVTENVKSYKDETKRPKNPTFLDMWEAPNWKSRPAHFYTDDDWEFIKELWSKEKRQGARPLYWEDVKVGDQPAWTADGPIEASCMPIAPWGMGIGGSRSMKKEIMEPKIFKTMIRGEKDGIYRLPNRKDYVPAIPDDPATAPLPPEHWAPAAADTRDGLMNFFGRDIALRHIHNWMGDRGWVYNIRWGIMPPELHAEYGKIVPQNPLAEHFLENVPGMKRRHLTAHGLTTDLAIVKSYVYDKYMRDGEYFVELAWWIESIDNYLWEEGAATVKLPSKNV